MSEITVNRQVKDRLFRVIFGGRYGKDNILSLYNAMNNTNYTNADDSTKTLRIPTPRCIIFYNGMSNLPAFQKHRLSDAFEKPTNNSDYEWTAEVYNLNHPDNAELIRKSQPLYEYCRFVTKIQDNLRHGLSKKDAVHCAVDEAILEGILYDILSKERNEVEMNILTEFDDEEFAKVMHDDGYDDGYIAGEMAGIEKSIITTLKKLGSYQAVSDLLEYDLEFVKQVATKYSL